MGFWQREGVEEGRDVQKKEGKKNPRGACGQSQSFEAVGPVSLSLTALTENMKCFDMQKSF